MKPWISAADAPGYEVVTLTTVFDSFGYCRIGRTVAARKPIRRISRLTTSASTGRLMKMSVIAALYLFKSKTGSPRTASLRGCRNAAVEGVVPSIARRLCRDRWRWIARDRDCRARLHLDLTDRNHSVAGLQPFED